MPATDRAGIALIFVEVTFFFFVSKSKNWFHGKQGINMDMVNMSDKSVTPQSLPGCGVNTEAAERDQ